MNEPAERRVGSVIAGKWRIDSLLGSGSMAAVYAVTHRNGARAALKILHPTLCADESVCERFLGEGYLTNSIKHPGIVRVHDDGMTDDGSVFLVMDLLEGRTLETFRQEQGGKVELPVALDLADGLMDILQAVHGAGIVHRDLKPQNVFLCDDGSIKLLDFGVARVDDGGSTNKSLFGLVLGTPSFMSPEQAVGARNEVDHRSDIWSLGATLFTVLTGETVHLGPHVQAKLLAAATAKARSISLVRQDLPSSVALIIDMSLRFNKEDRWQSVEAFRRALRDAREQLGLGQAPARVASRSSLAAAPVVPAAASPSTPPEVPAGRSEDGATSEVPTVRMESEPPDAVVMDAPSARITKTLIGVGAPKLAPKLDLSDDVAGGSYPAASNTMNVEADESLLSQVMARPSSGMVWAAACGLVLLAAGGVALFTMNKPAEPSVTESASAAQPVDTSATEPGRGTADPSTAPAVPAKRIDPSDLVKDASATPSVQLAPGSDGFDKGAGTSAQQPRMAHADEPAVAESHHHQGSASRSTAGVSLPTRESTPAAQDSPPPAAPVAPADPFSTPE